jgi:hypothetical protein
MTIEQTRAELERAGVIEPGGGEYRVYYLSDAGKMVGIDLPDAVQKATEGRLKKLALILKSLLGK